MMRRKSLDCGISYIYAEINFDEALSTYIPREGSEQTDPLNALPTSSPCWMGFQLTLCNLSKSIYRAVYL